MGKRDILTRLCDELEACKRNRVCYANEIICVKRKLQQYIGEDTNKLLELKAQVKLHNSAETDISILSFWLAAGSLVISATDALSQYDKLKVCCLILGISLFIFAISGLYNNQQNSRNKWRRYIETVLENWES